MASTVVRELAHVIERAVILGDGQRSRSPTPWHSRALAVASTRPPAMPGTTRVVTAAEMRRLE
jgi:transcriptional regulator with GAF, ATPase, and Fis domain